MRFLFGAIAVLFLLVIVDAEVAVLTPHGQATSHAEPSANQQADHQPNENGILREWVTYSYAAWPIRWVDGIDWSPDAITAAATVVLAALTIVLSLTSYFMWLATRRLVIGAETAAAREHRAYVYLQIGSRLWPQPPARANRHSVFLTVKNTGMTWARKVRVRRGRAVDPIGDAWDGEDWETPAAPMVLGPGEEISLQFGDIEIGHLPTISTGDTEVFYLAEVTYEDTVSGPPALRRTQLYRRFNVDVEGGISFTWMPTHNCADEDCP